MSDCLRHDTLSVNTDEVKRTNEEKFSNIDVTSNTRSTDNIQSVFILDLYSYRKNDLKPDTE